jgi:NAD(P)-dependent dehydrogenase (short-subunit alcohol dehydrogenase family)
VAQADRVRRLSERLAGKLALVTGAAQGLGTAIARRLVSEGARVLLTDRNENGVKTAAEELSKAFGEGSAYFAHHDVTSESDWIDVIAYAREELGGLSVLVNNAGIVLTGTVEDFTLDEWHQGMAVNTDSVFLGAKHALTLMRERQPGSIVNVSSIAGLIASHNFANYNASKAAVWLLSKSIALHCARQGWDIRCNSVHPAFIRTPILNDLVGDRDEATVMAKLAKQVPLGRLGEPDDVAHAVVYLASDESRFMTGAELKLDGGISAM